MNDAKFQFFAGAKPEDSQAEPASREQEWKALLQSSARAKQAKRPLGRQPVFLERLVAANNRSIQPREEAKQSWPDFLKSYRPDRIPSTHQKSEFHRKLRHCAK